TKRSKWIVKQKRYFERFEQSNQQFEYVSGETHRYLGRQYRLKVIPIDPGEKETVKLKGRFLRIRTRQKENSHHTRQLLNRGNGGTAAHKSEKQNKLSLQTQTKNEVPQPEMSLTG